MMMMMMMVGILATKVSLPAVSEENTIVNRSYRVPKTKELRCRNQT
jgi:hypothetical protein